MQKEFNKSEIFNAVTAVEYTSGGIVSKNIINRDTGNVSLFAFDEGEQLSPHSAPYDALVQVIEGTAEIKIEDQSYTLEAGESIIMPANITHSVYAADKFKMLLTMIKG